MSGPFGSSQWMYNPSSSFYPYAIDQSLRFEDGDSATLDNSADPFASDGNLKTWTWSCWVKRGNLGTNQTLWSCGTNNNNRDYFGFDANDNLTWIERISSTTKGQLVTVAKYRDVSAWYNVTVARDTDNVATADDRLKIYVNGVLQEESITNHVDNNHESMINRTTQHNIGSRRRDANDLFFDGYMADVVFVDGSALGPDSFGELKDGIWVAKDVSGLTFGQNGFHLDFADSSAIGNDVSGQNNDFAPSGGGSPTLVASDVVLDSPTNNFATMNPIHKGSGTTGSITYSEGNLASSFAGNHTTMQHAATMALPTTGKWYWEQTFTGALTNGSRAAICGIWNDDAQDLGSNNRLTVTSDAVTFYSDDNKIYSSADGSIGNVSYTSSIAEQTGAVVSFAVDMDNTWVWVAVNGTYINGTPDFSDGTNRVDVVTDTNGRYIPFWAGDGGQTITWRVNFGQDSANVSSANSDSKGIGTFEYAVPSGYTSLCSANLPEPAIISGEDYFNTLLWSGDGASSRGITGASHAPDFVWIKTRNQANEHSLFDSVRGVAKDLESNSTAAEQADNQYGYINSFDSDGFTVVKGSNTNPSLVNESGNTFVAWNWLAGGSAVSNTDGTITSSISANPEAGFSIVSWSGTSSAGTVGHGLSKVPSMYIVKNRTGAYFWAVYHSGLANPATSYIDLDNNVDQSTSQTHWNSTAPTDTVFSVNNKLSTNNSSHTYIAYCFADIEGYCKAGSYTGTNTSDNAYVHLGFRPAWVMCKSYTQGGSGYDWVIYDNKRSPANPVSLNLEANNTIDDEATRGVPIDFLSNGFKIRNSYAEVGSNKGYIYLAFAEQPFKYSNAR